MIERESLTPERKAAREVLKDFVRSNTEQSVIDGWALLISDSGDEEITDFRFLSSPPTRPGGAEQSCRIVNVNIARS